MSKLGKIAMEVLTLETWKTANNCIFDNGSMYLQFTICTVMFCIYT